MIDQLSPKEKDKEILSAKFPYLSATSAFDVSHTSYKTWYITFVVNFLARYNFEPIHGDIGTKLRTFFVIYEE